MKAELYEFDRIPFSHLGGYILQSITERRLTAIYHSHDFFELIVVRRGSALQEVNGRPLPLGEGEGVLLRPGDAHRFTEQTEGLSVVSLSVRREELKVMTGAYSPALYAHVTHAVEPPIIPLPPFPEEAVGETVFDCKYLLSFFLRAYIAAAGYTEGAGSLPPFLVSLSAQMHERDNLRAGISAALALSHYSQSHLARLVRVHYGMGLKEWINEMRLQTAYRELVLSDKSIATLADEVGFSSLGHFTRIFRQRFGITPAALRRRERIFTV